ncbi:MAG TPA: glycosyltransferase [Flavobacterium sp.]|uniref:glycosyltransferase family 2 protein n=2 Tax=Flavobacterium TaxID=237 RepID=UPI0025BC2DA0|nr:MULTISPECIES: glycosyltransferase [unclassified Flavobacterium]HRE77347.1 glycosyltransferase [Flavobacterium sp.]
MIKISVVIPVYNAENHLAECLDSVLNQSLSDIEVICIDDGSEDDSLTILKQYAETDFRLKILSQANQGVSVARNAGLEVAKGKYVSFVDGDDTIDKDFLQNLYNIIEIHEVDVVFSKLFDHESFNQFFNVLHREEIRNTLLRFFIKDAQFYSVCNKLFSNSIIQRNQIRFPQGVKLGEDGHFNIQFLICSEKVFFFDYCGYQYREVDESATRNIFKHNYIQKAVENYMIDWTPILGDVISSKEIQHLKKVTFVKKIISLTYIYANPKSGLSLKKRLFKLKEIINNQEVSDVFSDISLKNELNLTRYKGAIFDGIRNKNIFYIYILTLFSYYRNK